MALFNVLEPPDGKPERVAFVREGFCLGALLFTVLWALLHRMWVTASLLFAIYAVVMLAESLGLIGPLFAGAVHFAISLLFGFEARKLQSLSLERSGYQPAGLIEATSLEAAELSYFASRKRGASPQAVPVRIPAHPSDTLGIFGNV